MSIAHLTRLAELLSSVLIVFGFGRRSMVRDATSLFRYPLLLLRSLLAMNVLMKRFGPGFRNPKSISKNFCEFPPRQKPGTFNLDHVMEQVTKAHGQ
jgi:hypothetical protein